MTADAVALVRDAMACSVEMRAHGADSVHSKNASAVGLVCGSAFVGVPNKNRVLQMALKPGSVQSNAPAATLRDA